MLIPALLFSVIFTTSAQAENLNPTAAQSLQFQEAPKEKAGRGPASVTTTEPVAFEELTDEQTEAGFCLFCGSTGTAQARTMVEQSRDILKHAERASRGK